MHYLDTSAAMKLVRPEEHSEALLGWLAAAPSASLISSVLLRIELVRATRRAAPHRLARAETLLRDIGVIGLAPAILVRAAEYADPALRSLDAIHLGTAEHLAATTHGALEAFLAYDARLLSVARAVGLPVVSPGLS